MKPAARRLKSAAGATAAAGSSRARIVAGARRHFLAHGFRSVTMDDLAEELGMSKKTFYAHFRSKRALLEAVIRDKFAGMEMEFERLQRQWATDFPGALHQLLSRFQQETEELQPAFLRDMRRESPEVFRLVETRRREVIQRCFGRVFVAGRKSGVVRKDVPVPLLIEILLGAVQAVMNPPQLEELGLSPKLAFSGILTVVLQGVITRKGRSTFRN